MSGTLSDLGAFQSEAAQARLSAVATQLVQSMQAGVLTTGDDGTSVTVSTQMMDLVLVPSRAKTQSAAQQLSNQLVGQGVPVAEATAFTTALAGLLENETVRPRRLGQALQTYNAIVDVAPAMFLAQPPSDFIAARTMLVTLLGAASA